MSSLYYVLQRLDGFLSSESGGGGLNRFIQFIKDELKSKGSIDDEIIKGLGEEKYYEYKTLQSLEESGEIFDEKLHQAFQKMISDLKTEYGIDVSQDFYANFKIGLEKRKTNEIQNNFYKYSLPQSLWNQQVNEKQ
jgi:hypothetical protein